MTEVQFIEHDGKPAFAVVPIERWREIEAAIEDAADTQAIARFDTERPETFPISVVDAILAGASPVRVYREHRGMSQVQLADQAGITTAFLSQIETGKRGVSTDVAKRIAEALGVMIDDLV